MSEGPLVSIVTPTFNRAKLLARAIESVRSQTYESWELLIWDDGSSDGTQQFVMNVRDKRVCYHGGENRGPAFARNQALNRAKGEYIAFLDDDDQWLPGKLARQTEILERFKEVDVLFANFENLDAVRGTSKVSFDANRDVLSLMKTEPVERGVDIIREGFPQSLLKRNFVLPSSVMMRMSVHASAGFFNEGLRISEDKEFWWRCSLLGKCFASVDDILLIRRKGTDSASAEGERTRVEDLKALHCCWEDAEKAGQKEMVRIARRAIGTAWEDMSKFHTARGEKGKALKAIRQRIRFGVSWRASALAVCALGGAWTLRSAQRHPPAASPPPVNCQQAGGAKS